VRRAPALIAAAALAGVAAAATADEISRNFAGSIQLDYLAVPTEDVARKQGGERFSILYPASLPEDPIEPQPLRIMALAIVAGLVLGAVGAVGREFLDRSVHDSRALENEFEVPVLGEIPRITV